MDVTLSPEATGLRIRIRALRTTSRCIQLPIGTRTQAADKAAALTVEYKALRAAERAAEGMAIASTQGDRHA